MAKPEWGTKRTCQSCGARFYDFARSPIVCPACGTVFDVETLARARRTRPPARLADEANEPVVAAAEVGDDVEAEDVEDAGDEPRRPPPSRRPAEMTTRRRTIT